MLSLILSLVEENSWPLDGIIRSEVLETLNDVVPIVILDHLLDWYTHEMDNLRPDGVYLQIYFKFVFNTQC